MLQHDKRNVSIRTYNANCTFSMFQLFIFVDSMSYKCNVMNSVKQCGVLLPILFAVCLFILYGLLKRLENTAVACHMGGSFTGANAYAVDILCWPRANQS